MNRFTNILNFSTMYKVFVYYRVENSDELRFITLYGVYLNAGFLNWLSAYPNLVYVLVDRLKDKEDKS